MLNVKITINELLYTLDNLGSQRKSIGRNEDLLAGAIIFCGGSISLHLIVANDAAAALCGGQSGPEQIFVPVLQQGG